MARRCWDWCTQEHEHNFGAGAAGGGVRREFMTQAERDEIFEKTGVRVEDRADMRAAFKKKGVRDAEKGEIGYEVFDALRERAETGRPLDERFGIRGMNPFNLPPLPKFDARTRFLQHCNRLGIKPD